jgi:hypothetical protein
MSGNAGVDVNVDVDQGEEVDFKDVSEEKALELLCPAIQRWT